MGGTKSKKKITEWSVTFSLSLMDPFPRIDIFVSVSSCSLFNEFPRGPRSLPTKLNCNREPEREREREHRSIKESVFEIKQQIHLSGQSHLALKMIQKNVSAISSYLVSIGSVWKLF